MRNSPKMRGGAATTIAKAGARQAPDPPYVTTTEVPLERRCVKRTNWTDERLDERMDAINQKFDRLLDGLDGVREELRDLRSDVRRFEDRFAAAQDRQIQIGFGLVVGMLAALTALIVALVTNA